MKELIYKKGGQKTAYTYRNLRTEKAIGFLKVYSFESDVIDKRHELMDRGNAAVVLPVDFVKREAYLVEQPRHVRAFIDTEEGRALLERAKRDGWTKPEDEIVVPRDAVAMLECPAGMIDAGETPEAAALRELVEETGLILDESSLIRVASYFPSIGGTAERITAFIATLPENGTIRRAESLSDEDKDHVTVWKVGFDDIYAMLDADEVRGASSNILFRELFIRDRMKERYVRDAIVRHG